MKQRIIVHHKDGEKEIVCKKRIIKDSKFELNQYTRSPCALLIEVEDESTPLELIIGNFCRCKLLTYDKDFNQVALIDNLYREDEVLTLLIPEKNILVITKSSDINMESNTRIEFIDNPYVKFENKIKFLAQRELVIEDKSLIINVDSLDRMYPGGFSSLYSDSDFHGFTNGYIVVLTNLENNPLYFNEIINSVLEPSGFRKQNDYIIVEEEFAPEKLSDTSSKALWKVFNNSLNVFIDPDGANFVWHSKFDEEQNAFMSNIEKDRERPWLQYWTFWYSIHPVFKSIKLKTMGKTPHYTLDDKWIDKVKKEEYLKNDEDRLPFMVGSQFGVNPRPEKTFSSEYNGYIFMLCKSLLSGHVACIAIYYIENGVFDDCNRLIRIENEHKQNSRLAMRFQEVFKDEYKKMKS